MAKISRMGQTFKGDLEGGAVMWMGGSLGPVGSPGWRRREEEGRVVLKLRAVSRERVRGRVRGEDMVVGRGEGWRTPGALCCERLVWVSVG